MNALYCICKEVQACYSQNLFILEILMFVVRNLQVSGELEFGRQYHFYMETLVCRVERTEDDGFLIDTAVQAQADLQSTLSYAFKVPVNKYDA